MSHGPAHDLVGRDQLLNRLAAVVDRSLGGERASVLITGQSGVGKTSLVRAAAGAASNQGARVAWGTCVEGGAPGYWPWTQVLDHLVRSVMPDRARQLARDDASLLATIATGFGDVNRSEASDRGRLLLFDATTRWLDALAGDGPVVVVVDDLQWADESSLAMLDFVARAPQPAGVCLIGAYRHDELSPHARERLGALVAQVEHVQVEGLDREAVHDLVEHVAGHGVDRTTTNLIHRRTGGHPFFVRELAVLLGRKGVDTGEVPDAVRDAIERRIRRLPTITQRMLDVAAVVGTELMPDVIATTLTMPTMDVDAAARPALDAGILAVSEDALRFSHDLFRETILGLMEPAPRVALHHAVATALENRMTRAGDLAPSELARHFTAAIPLDGTTRAARWALAAAAADHRHSGAGSASHHPRVASAAQLLPIATGAARGRFGRSTFLSPITSARGEANL